MLHSGQEIYALGGRVLPADDGVQRGLPQQTLSILSEDDGWRPSITVKQILLGVQDLLDSPNPASPAQSEAYMLFTNDRVEYDKKVKAQSLRYPPPS